MGKGVWGTRGLVCLTAATALGWAAAAGALEPDEKCQALKNKDTGKLAFCLQKAEMKLVKTKGACSVTTTTECYRDADCPVSETCDKDLTKYNGSVTKCNTKFFDKWAKNETKAADKGGTCPDGIADPNSVLDFVTAHSDAISAALAGGGLPSYIVPGVDPILLATGQTQCESGGSMVACPGVPANVQDGDYQMGTARSYSFDTSVAGERTVIDNVTGLEWEVLCDEDPPGATCPTDHDVDTTYTWANAFTKIANMNAANYGGHNDWRLPNRFELESLADLGQVSPAIDPTYFNASCTAPCTADACTCTRSFSYWSSTTSQSLPPFAWSVNFVVGSATALIKSNLYSVRAVRGGS